MKFPAVIISGFAGSGKSTLAKRLAERFGLKYVCGGDVLKEIAREEGYNPTEQWWDSKEGMEFLKKRKENPEFDRKLDEKLMEIANEGNCVITSWALPWIYRGKAIKIWLSASQEERARRIAKRDNISEKEAMQIVRARDKENIELYKKIYGFELGRDLEVFDLIIDTNGRSEEEVEKIASEFLEKLLKTENKFIS